MINYSYYITLLALTLVIVGIHQSTLYGLANSYWIFMFSAALLLFAVILNKNKEATTFANEREKKSKPNKKGKKKR